MTLALGRDAAVGEEPLSIPRPQSIESQFYVGVGEPGDQACFEVDLEADEQVKTSAGQFPLDVAEAGPPSQAAATIEYYEVINGLVVFHQ